MNNIYLGQVATRFNAVRTALVLALVCASALTLTLTSQAYADGDRYTVIKTKKAVTVGGDEIDDASIVIVDGKIEAVGKNVDYPSDSIVIDATKLTAMPGMINPRTSIGQQLPNNRGNKSNFLVKDEFEPPEDDTYRDLLKAGYTLLGVLPNGSGLPGQALVVSTHDAKADAGIRDEGLVRITFGRPPNEKNALRAVLKEAEKAIKAEKEAKEKAEKEAEAKKKEAASKPKEKKKDEKKPEGKDGKEKGDGKEKKPTSQPASKPSKKKEEKKEEKKFEIKDELKAPVKLLKKDEAVVALVEFARASDVLHFVEAIEGFDFAQRYAFASRGYDDLHNIIEHPLIGGADATVMLKPLLPQMPLTVNPYNLARELIEEGCTVGFYPLSDNVREHETMRERVALLTRAGLKREDALKALTLVPAQYLGLEKQYGTLEKEKVADVVLLDGDPLDPFAKVQMVVIGGKVVFDRVAEEKDKR
jgi:hypothetical protein